MIAAPIATANIPKTTGTRINASTGVSRLLRIKYMKTAIMAKPRPTSIGAPLGTVDRFQGHNKRIPLNATQGETALAVLADRGSGASALRRPPRPLVRLLINARQTTSPQRACQVLLSRLFRPAKGLTIRGRSDVVGSGQRSTDSAASVAVLSARLSSCRLFSRLATVVISRVLRMTVRESQMGISPPKGAQSAQW